MDLPRYAWITFSSTKSFIKFTDGHSWKNREKNLENIHRKFFVDITKQVPESILTANFSQISDKKNFADIFGALTGLKIT